MLFDLQSRRRRTAVKIIYAGLAVLIAAGLVLLGVGTGTSGFLNSGDNHSSSASSVQNSAANANLRQAQKQVAANPTSATAYAGLVQAYYSFTGPYFNADTRLFSAGAKPAFERVIPAWTKYVSLVKGAPNTTPLTEAARAYTYTGDFTQAAVLWQQFLTANPGALEGYECTAFNAYAAKKTSLGNEAAAKVVALSPSADRLESKDEFAALAKSPTEAAQEAEAGC